MAVRKKRRTTKPKTKRKPKEKVVTTIEMEEAISRLFGIRTNIIVPNISWGLPGMHECDVFIVKKSGYAVEVEIKRTKADLLADFKKKHDHSDVRIREFYYALPEKLLETCTELIPEHAGIISCYKSQWATRNDIYATIKRKATIRKDARKLTQEEQFKVAKLGTMRIWSLKNKIIKLQNAEKKEKTVRRSRKR
jgi:hypothetical protein